MRLVQMKYKYVPFLMNLLKRDLHNYIYIAVLFDYGETQTGKKAKHINHLK